MNAVFVGFLLCYGTILNAQDSLKLNQVVEAYSNSFSEKDFQKLEPFLSEKYKIGSYSFELAGQIIPQIYSQYPEVDSITLESCQSMSKGFALDLNYHFKSGEKEKSFMVINPDYKILEISLFDRAMNESDNSTDKKEIESITSKSFFTKKMRQEFYNILIKQIEQLDAEAISTRNLTKKVKWEEYKKTRELEFLKAKKWSEFETAFMDFGKGFVNLHSHFSFNSSQLDSTLKTDFKLGFTFPEIQFFEIDSKKEVSHINGKPIREVYEKFENWNCGFSGVAGSLSSFKRAFESGNVKINGELPQSVRINGKAQSIKYTKKEKSKDRYASYKKGVDLNYDKDWRLIEKGYKVALLTNGNVALIRIKDFLYFKGNGGEVRCKEKASDSTMCGDIQLLRKGLKSLPETVKHLIFDVQNNGGGNENSSFITEFAQQPFYDLAVQYRKTKMLEDDELRAGLLYSQEGETWYQEQLKNGIYDSVPYGEFLPKRADFCRGDPACAIKAMQPNEYKQERFQIYVLTNGNCVSSCDDFVWRMQEYSNAKLIGQLQAADATYSRITVVFYLMKNGEIKTKCESSRDASPNEGNEICRMTIPYSKTVFTNGETRQGVPAKLDVFVPITKENFESQTNAALQKCLELID